MRTGSSKGWRRPSAQLRTLDDRQLAAVAAGTDEYKPSESLRLSDQAIIFWYSGGTASGGGPHV